MNQDRESGAVAAMTAIVVGAVLLAVLALSVDVGSLTLERRQLQNAADSTAQVLAKHCATKSAECGEGNASLESSLVQLMGSNSFTDGASQLAKSALPGGSPYPNGYCGSGVSALTACATLDSTAYADLTMCPPVPPWAGGLPYVEVYSLTKSSEDANTTLKSWFSPKDASASKWQTACARAAWGPAGDTGTTIPMIATRCFYDEATANGTKLIPAPPYVAPDNQPATSPVSDIPVFDGTYGDYAWAIEAHENNASSGGNQTTCTERKHNGQTYPGGFSWIKPVDGTCSAQFDDSGDLTGESGASPPQPECKKPSFDSWLGKEVFIPIAGSWTKSGTYHIDGVASFYLAGYANLGGGVGTNAIYNRPTYVCTGCNPSYKYIWGWFTSGIKPVGSIGSGPSLGASVIVPAG